MLKLRNRSSRCKVKVNWRAPLKSIGGLLISLVQTIELIRGWVYHWICDAWPVWRLPSSCEASLFFGWYQIILHGNRGMCVSTTSQSHYMKVERPGVESATSNSSRTPLTKTAITRCSSFQQQQEVRHNIQTNNTKFMISINDTCHKLSRQSQWQYLSLNL